MQARLIAVQQALLLVTAVASVIALVVHPAPKNGVYRRALGELTSVQARFDKAQVEQALLEHARAQGRLPLATLCRTVGELRPLELTPQDSLRQRGLDPLVHLQLDTLADIERFSQPNVSLPIATVEPSSVSRSLAWRLARDMPEGAPVRLVSAKLWPAHVGAAEIARDAEAFPLQSAASAAAVAVATASTELERIEKLYEARVKRRVSPALRAETYRARLEARKTLRQAHKTQHQADARFAEATQPTQTRATAPLPAALPQRGIVKVEVERAGERTAYALPVEFSRKRVALPPLQGAQLRQTHAAGIWDEVKAMTIPQARAHVVDHFNWHFRQVQLAGVTLSGVTALQLLPCALPLMLGFLLRRMRAVTKTYNPFRMHVQAALPRVGFSTRALDALALVALPLTAATFAIASLVLIGQLPALPLIAAVMSLMLGAFAFVKLGELQSLAEDMFRSHRHTQAPEESTQPASQPPPSEASALSP